jgi:hypothetical protein
MGQYFTPVFLNSAGQSCTRSTPLTTDRATNCMDIAAPTRD